MNFQGERRRGRECRRTLGRRRSHRAETFGKCSTGPVGLAWLRTPPAFAAGSILAEAPAELSVVVAVDIAVAIEVEVPQVAGVGGGCPECGSEDVAVLPIHVA